MISEALYYATVFGSKSTYLIIFLPKAKYLIETLTKKRTAV